MPHKFFLLLALTLILGVSILVLFMSRETAVAPVVPEPQPIVEENPIPSPQEYSQHIESIPGSADEVWYNIPELGVRMRLNKEFAGDLVYQLVHDKNIRGEVWDAVYFTTGSLLGIDADCSDPLGAMSIGEGQGADNNQLGYQESNDFGQVIFQFPNRFVVWQASQDICWNPSLEEEVRKVFPGKYNGLGAKSIREGIKQIELIPQNRE